jgi:four helix bundle protein
MPSGATPSREWPIERCAIKSLGRQWNDELAESKSVQRSFMQDFRKILVWRRSHGLVLAVRKAISRFPRSGYSSLKQQIIRAVESIPLNIVEGSSSRSNKEYARFLDISFKSANELDCQLLLARDLKILSPAAYRSFEQEIKEIRKMLFRLQEVVREDDGD